MAPPSPGHVATRSPSTLPNTVAFPPNNHGSCRPGAHPPPVSKPGTSIHSHPTRPRMLPFPPPPTNPTSTHLQLPPHRLRARPDEALCEVHHVAVVRVRLQYGARHGAHRHVTPGYGFRAEPALTVRTKQNRQRPPLTYTKTSQPLF